MNREIKFRQRLKNGDWHYWSRIIEDEFCGPVSLQQSLNGDGDQYTGLKDKNGTEIYEGDIVKAYICFGPGGDKQITYPVTISPFGVNIEAWTFGNESRLPEVIGNIHENPELVGE